MPAPTASTPIDVVDQDNVAVGTTLRGRVPESGENFRTVRRWTRTSHRVIRVYDYMTHAKSSGYRGVHVIVEYDGFAVEVQLRTRLQHAWGVAIEKVGPRIGSDLKSGEGPTEVLELFRTFGDVLAHAEDLPADDPSGSEFLEVIDGISPEVLRLVGLQVVDNRIRLVLPE